MAGAFVIRPITRAEAEGVLGSGRREGVNVEKGQLFGIEQDGRIVAIGSFKVRGVTAVLSMDFTEPEYRGRGMHQALLAHRLDVARSRGCQRAEASCLGPSARNYLKAGFVIVQQRKHGWLMRRPL